MNEKDFKPLTVEDFNLKPEEMTELVEGAAKFLPPEEDSIDVTQN